MYTLAGLTEKVSISHLAQIANHLNDWESLRPFLDLSRSKATEILKSYPNNFAQQKLECLEEWQQLKGDTATYHTLILAAEDAKLQKLADGIREMLKK